MPATARRSAGVIAREAAQYQFLDFCDAALKKPLNISEPTRAVERQDKPCALLFDGVAYQHRRDREQAKVHCRAAKGCAP